MKYGFIGCGNMGGAIARILRRATADMALSDRSGKGKLLAEELGCQYTDCQTIAKNANVVIFAVKPQMFAEVCAQLSPALKENQPLIISMAAGITTEKLTALIGVSLPIIRIMPNTPVGLGIGMTPYCYNSLTTQQHISDFLADFRFAGVLDSLPEQLMDAASALSGSGPAYLYQFCQAMADGAVQCGMDRNKAILYTAQTMAGAAQMLLQPGADPAALRAAVCSPGGSTLEGLKALDAHGFNDGIMACIQAAHKRNIELGK